MNKNFKIGFTLAESLITMGIIAIVATICLPIMNSNKPNKEIVMLKKAYYLTERVVSELVNDDDFYPYISREITGLAATGDPLNSDCDGGTTKFCCLFAEKVNVSGTIDCTAGTSTGTKFHFTTSDGIAFSIPISNFSASQTIIVDVNGDGEGVDAMYNANTQPSPDRFEFRVAPSGRITVSETGTQTYLNAKKLTARTVSQANES